MSDDPVNIDEKAAARVADISPRHLRNLVTQGKLPAPMRLGRSVRYHLPTLLQALEALAKGEK